MEPPYSPRRPGPRIRKLGYIAVVLLLSLVAAVALHHLWLFVVLPPVFWTARTMIKRRRQGPAKAQSAEPQPPSPSPVVEPASEAVTEESTATKATKTGDGGSQSPISSRILDVLLYPIGRWGFWKVGLVGILLLAALSWATNGFRFDHAFGNGGGRSHTVLMDGKVPVQHTDRTKGMTQEQVLALAGLPKSIRFYTKPVTTLSKLPPGMASWTPPDEYGQEGNRGAIWEDAPIGIYGHNRFEPWGSFQLLVVNTGHILKGVYFPSNCSTLEHLGNGPPAKAPTVPIILVKVVTGTCS